MKISRIDSRRCMVGEGPVWDVQDQALFYVDIVGKVVCKFDPIANTTHEWEVPGVIGSMALRESGGAIVALKDGIYALDFNTGETNPYVFPDQIHPRAQFNDGKVDRRGRFVVGATDSEINEAIGDVYSLENGKLTTIAQGITISNGPCWSPDDNTFYFADSKLHTIYAYDYDIESGATANRRVFANTEALGGIPDGATVDSDGLLWVAICEGGKVVAFRPNGKIERIIDLPETPLTASVMFGGKNLDQLYVTTINPDVVPWVDRPAGEGEGFTYVIEDLGVTGIPEPRYLG